MWTKRSATIYTGLTDVQVIFNDPPPVGVDHSALRQFLLTLPEIPEAARIICAARLYRTALELIESRPDIAYQLLISTTESLAVVAIADYEPEEAARIVIKKEVQKQAIAYGLSEQQANNLALLASKGLGWTKKKFVKFLTANVSREELLEKDRVFLTSQFRAPGADDFEQTLERIYNMRSGSLHTGSSFPRSVGLGTRTGVNWREVELDRRRQREVPPVPWFERVVSLATQKYLLDKCEIKSAPFIDAS